MVPDRALLDAVRNRVMSAPVSGVRFVAVDGPSGAGKSTLAAPLAAMFDAPVIEVDDFVSWGDFAGWWPRFEAQVLQPLLRGQDAVYQRRDWIGDEFGAALGAWRTVPWAPVVVIEGVTSTRAAVQDRLACRIWVEAPADERLRRGIARDGESHRGLWERWMREEAAFFEEDGARDRADFIVSTARAAQEED
jgi:uridine kinase